jgi:hypothetical protein
MSVIKQLRSLFRGKHVDVELDEEMQFHIEMKTREYIENRMDAAEARTKALRAFGGVEKAKEQCRDVRRTNLLESSWQDFRYGAWRWERNGARFWVWCCAGGLVW